MTFEPDVAQSIADYLDERCGGLERIAIESDLLAVGILDSLAVMDLLAYLEEDYGVRFEPQEISPANFRTARTVARLVEAKLAHGTVT